ncbi:MAG: hypothetical protein QNK23_14435 [Crocinitomicaceae bacterium]|nr:hypothetical protein [Crocinitomicaceae bacterium]
MEYIDKLSILTKALQTSKKVNSFDEPNEPQSSVLAHSLLDCQESFKEVSENLIPKLFIEGASTEELEDALHDIGEELRHVLYHINDAKFYSYLIED